MSYGTRDLASGDIRYIFFETAQDVADLRASLPLSKTSGDSPLGKRARFMCPPLRFLRVRPAPQLDHLHHRPVHLHLREAALLALLLLETRPRVYVAVPPTAAMGAELALDRLPVGEWRNRTSCACVTS